jgi:hypothetical protein
MVGVLAVPPPGVPGVGVEPAGASVTGSAYGQAVLARNPFQYWRMGSTTKESDNEVPGNSLKFGQLGNSPVVPGVSGALLGDADTAFGMNSALIEQHGRGPRPSGWWESRPWSSMCSALDGGLI